MLEPPTVVSWRSWRRDWLGGSVFNARRPPGALLAACAPAAAASNATATSHLRVHIGIRGLGSVSRGSDCPGGPATATGDKTPQAHDEGFYESSANAPTRPHAVHRLWALPRTGPKVAARAPHREASRAQAPAEIINRRASRQPPHPTPASTAQWVKARPQRGTRRAALQATMGSRVVQAAFVLVACLLASAAARQPGRRMLRGAAGDAAGVRSSVFGGGSSAADLSMTQASSDAATRNLPADQPPQRTTPGRAGMLPGLGAAAAGAGGGEAGDASPAGADLRQGSAPIPLNERVIFGGWPWGFVTPSAQPARAAALGAGPGAACANLGKRPQPPCTLLATPTRLLLPPVALQTTLISRTTSASSSLETWWWRRPSPQWRPQAQR